MKFEKKRNQGINRCSSTVIMRIKDDEEMREKGMMRIMRWIEKIIMM